MILRDLKIAAKKWGKQASLINEIRLFQSFNEFFAINNMRRLREATLTNWSTYTQIHAHIWLWLFTEVLEIDKL